MSFRPSFSLRTLLCAVLAAAAIVTLYLHYAPWRLARTYPVEGGYKSFGKFSPDCKWLVENLRLVEEDQRRITFRSTLYNTETGESKKLIEKIWNNTVEEYDRSDFLYSFTHDSKTLITGVSDRDRTVFKIWDIPTQSERTISPGLHATARNLDFTWNNRFVKFYLKDQTCVLFNLATGATVPQGFRADNIYVSNSTDRMVVLDTDGDLRILRQSTLEEIRRIRPPVDWQVTATRALIGDVLWLNAQQTEYDQYLDGPAMLHIDLRDTADYTVLRADLLGGSEDDSRLAFGFSDEKQIAIVSSQTAQDYYRLSSDWTAGWGIIEWSPDSQRFYLYGNNTVHDNTTGKILYTLPDGQFATFSKDHSRVIYENYMTKAYHLHDGHTGEFLQAVFAKPQNSMNIIHAFSPDNETLYHCDCGSQIQVWKRHRPEQFWGLAWLPEFWLALACSAALLRSLYCDWRDRPSRKQS